MIRLNSQFSGRNLLHKDSILVCYKITTVVQNAWRRGQDVSIHGWIYGIVDGIVHDHYVTVTRFEQVPEIYHNESCPPAGE